MRRTVLLLTLVLLQACGREQSRALKPIEEYLKSFGAREVKADLFLPDKNNPTRAYMSVTATYNFANSKGELQKEYLGFLLKKDGDQWKIEKNVPYTTSERDAEVILAGLKP
jgi:hypothetical protein